MGKFDLDNTTLAQLFADAEAASIVENVIPGASSHPMLQVISGMPAAAALRAASGRLPDEDLTALKAKLEAL